MKDMCDQKKDFINITKIFDNNQRQKHIYNTY